MTWLISGRADCRAGKRPEHDSAQQCQAYAEKQDSEIDMEVGFVGIGVFWQARDDEPNGPVGNKDAQPRSGQR